MREQRGRYGRPRDGRAARLKLFHRKLRARRGPGVRVRGLPASMSDADVRVVIVDDDGSICLLQLWARVDGSAHRHGSVRHPSRGPRSTWYCTFAAACRSS